MPGDSASAGVSRMRTFDETASAQARALYVEEIRYGKGWNSLVTVDLPDSRHPRIAALSGTSPANPTSMGSRTRRRRSIIAHSIAPNATTVDSHYGNNKLQGFDSSRRCKWADGPLCSALPVCRVGAGHRLRAKRRSPCLRTVVGVGRSCLRRRGAATHSCSLD